MADDVPTQAPIPEPTQPEPAQEAPTVVEMPVPAPAEATAPETQTAQVPVNEPLPPEPEPFDSTQDKPTPAPEPQAATSAPATPAPTHPARDLLVKARATIQDRKRKKLDKILEALDGKGPTTLKLRRAGKITNDEVEKLLHVSDATATRYLSALEKEGKIQQVGKTGKAVEYTKI